MSRRSRRIILSLAALDPRIAPSGLAPAEVATFDEPLPLPPPPPIPPVGPEQDPDYDAPQPPPPPPPIPPVRYR